MIDSTNVSPGEGGIVVAYSGVHQSYQLALAMYEMGRLDRFYCSLFDAPGKWGGLASRIFGASALTSRRVEGLPSRWVKEYPWPLLMHAVSRRSAEGWGTTNDQFDRYVAARLPASGSQIFVGVETCAEHSFRAARQLGMTTVLDCPQVHSVFLTELLTQAAANLDLPPPPAFDSPAMHARKEAEYALADVILTPSEIAQRSFLQQGFDATQVKAVSLWADTALWHPPVAGRPRERSDAQPLRALFVGKIDLRKGVPYLLQAARQCRGAVELSMVGARDPDMERLLQAHADDFRYIPPKTKLELREIYWETDVLVMPSLVDTFGFVAMEAMACGVPVIVSENSGVPVPDPSWRMPMMDANAIAARLSTYAADRELCREHGDVAQSFARTYLPETYRRRISEIMRELLVTPSSSGWS